MANLPLSLVCVALLFAGVATSTYTVVEQEYSTGVPGLEGHSLVILEGDDAGEPQPIAELQTLEATGETATSVLSLLTCVVVTPFTWFDEQVQLFQELEIDLVPDSAVEAAISNDGIPTSEAPSAEQLLQQLKVARMQDALNDYAAMQDRLWSLFETTASTEEAVELETLYATADTQLDGANDAEGLSEFAQLLQVLSGNSSEVIDSTTSEQVDQAQEGFELVIETLLNSEEYEDHDTSGLGFSQLQFEMDDEDYELSNIEGTTTLEKLVLHLAAISAAAGAAAYSDNTMAAQQGVQDTSTEVVNDMSWAIYGSDGVLNTPLVIFIILCVGCLGMAIGFVVALVQLQRTVAGVKVAGSAACRDVEPGLTTPLVAAKGYQQHKLEHVEVAADYIALPTSKH